MRSQNYGAKKVKALAKNLVKERNLEGKCTSHSFRRTSSTTLVESGVPIASLCHAGRWKDFKMAEGHTEHRNLEKSDRESRLDGNAAEPCAKRPRLDE